MGRVRSARPPAICGVTGMRVVFAILGGCMLAMVFAVGLCGRAQSHYVCTFGEERLQEQGLLDYPCIPPTPTATPYWPGFDWPEHLRNPYAVPYRGIGTSPEWIGCTRAEDGSWLRIGDLPCYPLDRDGDEEDEEWEPTASPSPTSTAEPIPTATMPAPIATPEPTPTMRPAPTVTAIPSPPPPTPPPPPTWTPEPTATAEPTPTVEPTATASAHTEPTTAHSRPTDASGHRDD